MNCITIRKLKRTLIIAFVLPLTACVNIKNQAPGTPSPAVLFGMDIHSGVLSTDPWPPVPMVGIRLWDTYSNWDNLEPSNGVYDWSNLDAYLALAQANNVDILYTFGGTPDWAASGSGSQCVNTPGFCYPPAKLEDWDKFVSALAAHSAGRIRYWELWNEANLPIFWSGDMPTLVVLAEHAYKIIKAADPDSVILSPSSTGNATDLGDFINAYFSAGGLPYTDAIAFHGYPSVPEDVLALVAAVKGSMAANGAAGKPVWNTEGSWGLDTNISSPADKAGFLARAYLLQWSSGVSRFYWYAWNNRAWGTLWTPNGIQPAGIAYGQLGKWLAGATMSAPCAMASDFAWTCTLLRPGGDEALAVWNSSTTLTYAPASRYKQYVNLAGDMNPVNGVVTIGYSPILLVNSSL